MRVARVLAGIAGVALVVPAIAVGCINQADNCERAANCVPSAAGGTGTTTGGNDAGTPPSCVPSQAEGAVEDKCGIFVSASVGNDANSGTKGSPVATIGHAILEANGTNRPIYVCNEAFTEVVEAPAGVELYGGLDCASGWTWSEAGRTTLTAASDSVPLKLTSGTAVTRIENFAVTAADATQPGGSSIAAIIDNVTAEITRTELTAGAARDGDNGKTPADVPMNGPGGEVGTMACTAPADVKGGAGAINMCAVGVSQGGIGGKGGITADGGDAGDGEDGLPAGNTNKGTGATVAAPSCTIGTPGADGAEGGPGMGGTGSGAISIVGYSGANGGDGATGTPGQGGGGGGGSRSGNFCNGSDGAGASGGGGGAGGCGGKGGEGGRAGGSSIALIALNSGLTLSQVTLKAGNAGKGGDGTIGQAGASGGPGGAGGASSGSALSKKGCTGGEGGTGGPGGPSGGGRGGHSLGIAYKGKLPVMDAVTATVGAPGMGGMGGMGNPMGGGDAGMASADPILFE